MRLSPAVRAWCRCPFPTQGSRTRPGLHAAARCAGLRRCHLPTEVSPRQFQRGSSGVPLAKPLTVYGFSRRLPTSMKKTQEKERLDLLQGTLDMLILRTLQWGPQHGHGIGQAIRMQSDDLLKVETGSLYPALHRLVKRRLLKAEWGVSEANQRAKYYRLTAAGRAHLSREQNRWAQLVHAIGRIMNPPAAEPVTKQK
jgi:PadR family transcriptional regulator, regulatory protein PadR